MRLGRSTVLSIGKLAAGQHNYYLATVALGAEEYYTGSGEAPGRWTGGAAELLGLDGEVSAHDLAAVLDARQPAGPRLTGKQGRPRVPGFDCTFNAPKSVSLLFALAPREIARHVRDAHDVAVDAALSVLETEASRARRGRGGATQVEADGFVAAAFRHRTSRAGDPHVHTHVLVANLAHVASEDRWSALDGRPLYAWAKTAGYLYEAKLRAELTERIGVRWHDLTRGIADIDGIPKAVLRHFSQRRQQIEAHMDTMGTSNSRAAQVATYATRTAKDPTTPILDLYEQWRDRAAALGVDRDTLAGLCDGTRRHEPVLPDTEKAESIFRRLASPVGLTKHRSTFNRRDVIQQICDQLPDGADPAEVQALAEAFLSAPRHVVPLTSGAGDRIRRSDGRSAPVPADARQFTTPEMLKTEAHLLRMATHRRDAGVAVASPEQVIAAIAARPTLTEEQQAIVQRICRSGDGVDVVEGVAGAGKTFTLAAAKDAWEAAGHRVIGATLAATAARKLEDGSDIASSTLDRLLIDLDRPETGGLRPDHVVVIDEAAMVGTRKLVRLVEHAHRANAKVVLIGDPCQLPEIEAGGAFAALARRLDRTALTGNRRQHEPWERQALADLRHGRTEEALDAYLAHGRVHTGDGAERVSEDMVEEWWSSRGNGEATIMLAAHYQSVDELNRQARARLRAAGELGDREASFNGRSFAVGDTVLALRNDYRTGVLNGTRGTIAAIDEADRHLGLVADDGRRLAVPFDYAEQGQLTHGYAMTVHKAQGATANRVLLLVDETMAREHLYTGLSRGRVRNDVYLVDEDARAEIGHTLEQTVDPLDRLQTSLARTSAKGMAIEQAGPGL